ncbi:hypothetical protein PHK61_17005 [Actinomycetospora lutea]|nr:hypothetical protein [Actinomycetospora lutea]MDD7940123.1 hypothetical protein [Actinomycetospora lutea]
MGTAAAQAAIWARVPTPSFARRFSVCRSAVRSLMPRRRPIWRLVSPSATSRATSSSRAVTPWDGALPTAARAAARARSQCGRR